MVSCLTLALLNALHFVHALPHVARQEADPTVELPTDTVKFDWDALKPVTDLKLTTGSLTFCGTDRFLCARLEVPLDSTKPDGEKAYIAVTMLPAINREGAGFKGSILFNPGGPGNSGTREVLKIAPALAALTNNTYDIVGFDPRGVGHTIPNADCFELEEWVKFQQTDVVSIDSKDELALTLARADLVGQKCAAVLGETAQFLDTASTANDMLSIARALGQEKVNYFGVGYGTILGQYFAAMHPDNVGLMILDGNIDAELWRQGSTEHLLQDADNTLAAFAVTCNEHPDSCPLHEDTPEAVLQRVQTIIENLRINPIPVPESTDGQFIFTADIARFLVRDALFSPLRYAGVAAQILVAAETGNTTVLAAWAQRATDPNTGLLSSSEPNAAALAVIGSDFPDLGKLSFDDLSGSLDEFVNTSAAIGTIASREALNAKGWKVRPKNPFTGPLEAKKHSGKILLLNNQLDPQSPLNDAVTIQKRFANSALVVQEFFGHTTLSNLGQCVVQRVAAFFLGGVLPQNGSTCDFVPFNPADLGL